ncbi:MAG: CCA tRNA nucleotidyltransferase [Phycisphaeraceae bacterium]|nr:CCA tRNA nucleotidyltransferase [Phycisphaeraceae bacterium]
MTGSSLDQDHPAREAATAIVKVLQQAGHVAYLAGGCVRDELLGLEPKDYDVATDAVPERVRSLFRGSRLVGEAFGVVLVRQLGVYVEVATFRREGEYSDGRRPDFVEFSDAPSDASRRDFTVNALFENPLAEDPKQRIIDYVGGLDDLRRKILRSVGNADQRFGEDFLRLLRAVRFAARLGFTIEEQTAKAIRRHATSLNRISRERIGQEVLWMLTGPRPALAANLVQELALDAPTLQEDNSTCNLLILSALEQDPTADYGAALAAWMLDRRFGRTFWADFERRSRELGTTREHGSQNGSADVVICLPIVNGVHSGLEEWVNRWREALCLSNDQRSDLQETIEVMVKLLSWSQENIAGKKHLMAEYRFEAACQLLKAMGEGWAKSKDAGQKAVGGLLGEIGKTIARESPDLIAQGVAPKPLIDGNDLIALGCQPGPELGQLLQMTYDAQLEGEFASREEALAWVGQKIRQAQKNKAAQPDPGSLE